MPYKKIGTNKYRVWVELGKDIFGKRQRKYETAYSLVEAKKIEAELIKKYYHTNNTAVVKDITFKEYSKIFLERYCKENVSKITQKGYERMLKVVNELIGDYKLSKITSYILETMYLRIKTRNEKELSVESMLHYHRLINVMFVQAIKWQFVNENPNINVNRPRKQKINRVCYDFNQVNYLKKCLENESLKYRTLIFLAIDSGARRGELCDLTWEDINFNENKINITSSLKVIDGVVDNKAPKNSYSIRTIYISSITINLLKEFKDYQIKEWERANKQFNEKCRVFSTPKCSYMYPDTCSKIINKIVKKYGLPKITLHGLRHTSASLLINNGIDPKSVSDRLGHYSTSTTMDIYTHSFESSKIEMGKKFDAFLQ